MDFRLSKIMATAEQKLREVRRQTIQIDDTLAGMGRGVTPDKLETLTTEALRLQELADQVINVTLKAKEVHGGSEPTKVAAKCYRVTILRCDGTSEVLEETPEKPRLPRLRELVGGNIESIPPAYYEHRKWGQCDVWADEDGRANGKTDNLHFSTFPNGRFMPPIVGDCIKVQLVNPSLEVQS